MDLRESRKMVFSTAVHARTLARFSDRFWYSYETTAGQRWWWSTR